MPIVTVKARSEWALPFDFNVEWMQRLDDPQSVTVRLGAELPNLAAKAMSNHGFETSSDGVVAEYKPVFALSDAFPGIWVTLSPIWHQEREKLQTEIRDDFHGMIGEELHSLCVEMGLEPPVHDTEVIFQVGCGISQISQEKSITW